MAAIWDAIRSASCAAPVAAMLGLSAMLALPPEARAQVELPVGLADTQAQLPAKADGYYNLDSHITVLVHEGAQTAGQFWSQQFAFVTGDGGYMGIQTNGRDNNGNRLARSAVFSMFDNKATVARGVDAADSRCKRFDTAGGDGRFVSCIIPFNWVEGREYRLRIWANGEPAATTRRWSAWIIDVASGAETFIGSIDVPRSWGFLNSYANAFTEFFGPNLAACANLPYTFARWRNIAANNGDPVNVPARFNGYPNYPSGYERCVTFARAAVVDGAVFHETGFGNTQRDGVDLTIAYHYRSGLGRQPDAGGFAYWRGFTRNTGTGEQCATALRFVSQSIMTSVEFTNRWADTANRVDRLYLTLLHRDPDDAGRNYWIGRVNATRNWNAIVVEFLSAAETVALQRAICGHR